MISKRHTLQYPAPGTRSGRWGQRGTVLHRSGPTRPLDPTQLLRNIMLERYLDSNFKRRLDRFDAHRPDKTVLHCPGLTKTTTTTPYLNNIELKAALTLTPDNCRTNRLLYSLIHTSSTKLN
ncbi:hypothetical protein HBH51_256390 [Parastagonospora nodorum]|nr:hypothetical protein HBH51_256390 [Parastagonospora nodorum]